MANISPFILLLWFLGGFVGSIAFGSVGSVLVWYIDGEPATKAFVEAYVSTFKTVITFGLTIGTTLVLLRTQKVVQSTIESSFSEKELNKSKYFEYRRKFWLPRKTVLFGASITIVGFVLFTSFGFPLRGAGATLMIIAACAQYTLGAFVGRKLMYTGMMLHSLREIRITRNLFANRQLDDVNVFVVLMSTLTIVFVYFHVSFYFSGPFEYSGFFGNSLKPFVIFPAVIATPVLLIFNFYPREIIRRVYDRSIQIEMSGLKKRLRNESLTDFEKRAHLLEFAKMSRDEVRYRMQLTLSDLPFGITILVMVIQPLLK